MSKNYVEMADAEAPFRVLDTAGAVLAEALYPRDAVTMSLQRAGSRVNDAQGRALVVSR